MALEFQTATVLHCANILKLLKTVYRSMPHKLPECEDDTAMHWIIEVIHKGFVVIAVEDGKLVGSIGIELVRYPWNRTVWNYRNAWLAVHPKHRAGGVADTLIKWAVDYAKFAKTPLVIGSNSTEAADLKDRYFRQKGFRYLGGDFAIEVGEE